ncbi:hypothetical protein RB213_005281 [Colletotrichum asianum]|uniref:Uncharacterized protein n=1 Tax=Colletotrichum asianum TaxID=702518 RepID=A0A8H3W071_9PEZI|nr:hypothetical protein GQ607_014119 [Colletotrichum asianum]
MSSGPPTSRVFVHLSFKGKRQDDGTRRGCLTIRYVEAEDEFIPGSILGVDSWIAALVPFHVQPERLSDNARAEIERAEPHEISRFLNYYSISFGDQVKANRDQWLKIHKDIIQTLKGFTVRRFNERKRELELSSRHERFSRRRRVWTLEGMPILQIRASPNEWAQLRQKIQSLPDIPVRTPELIKESLEQLTTGMEKVSVLSNSTDRRFTDAICLYRVCGAVPEGTLRVLPRWI